MIKNFLRTTCLSISILTAAASAQAAPQIMQGPMIGHVDQSSAKIWARIAGEAEFVVRYSENANFSDALETAPIRASAASDYCVEAQIEGLKAGSFYYYQVLVDGELLESSRERDGYPFLTAPSDEMEVKFSIAFGAGARTEIDGMQAIWLQVQNARPHAFFWLGDNESSEGLAPELQAEQYRKQRGIPFLQPLLRSIPQLATWDGAKAADETSKSLDIFKRYWANPSYGETENAGSYFKYNYGGVDFFFLDTYSFREEDKTLLGDRQMEWLKQELTASSTPFKMILSSSSWTDLKEDSTSTWTAFPQERSELLSFIKDAKIDGVALLSGDKDQAEIKAIPMSEIGGYDLYELVSSPLAQEPTESYDAQEASTISLRQPYAESMNFGLLTFDMEKDEATMTFEIIDVYGESVFSPLVVKASELTNGNASWQTKIDDPEAFAAF